MTHEFNSDGGIDAKEQQLFRSALGAFATGVAIVTTRGEDGEKVGLTINSFASVSLDPPLVLWCLANHSENIDLFTTGRPFSINVLTSEQKSLAETFASPRRDRFRDVALAGDKNGAPIIDGALAWFECHVDAVHAGGDHQIIIGRVARFGTHEGSPLMFQGGQYL